MTTRGRRLVGPLALGALLVLAGCSIGTGGGVPDRTPTLTPAPIPGGERAATTDASGSGGPRLVEGRQVAPGLRTGGVADPFALARAHHAQLSDHSFTRADSRTVVDGNGTLRATRTDIEVARGGTPFLLTRSSVSAPRYDVNAPYSDAMIYHDGDAAFYRLVAADNVTYGTDAGATAAEVESDRTGSDAVLGLLTTFRWEVTRLEIGGAVRYRLESTAVVAPDALDDAYLLTDPRDAEVRMLVGPDGRVYRYRLEYETTYDGRRAGVTETARWSDVGTTTVDPPGWLDRARNESVGAPSEGETRP
ncbi:hypothetical protein [Haloglomus halophilum]|uniref:hypothetical protein n=1 Tax=Haloglomus halophilum TaxID=2962672 RepID=UPI0020C97933|nr:hypothetical protein [Haloglomus halophilum]